ncbi:MAG: hypothetical protein GX561_01475 [Lentisphaerae bacterium]|jgi:hypothetical protein|nr:hypothetical protein [Lentisphaerota bacterium]
MKYALAIIIASLVLVANADDIVKKNQMLKDNLEQRQKQASELQEQIQANNLQADVINEAAKRTIDDNPKPVEDTTTKTLFMKLFEDNPIHLKRVEGDKPKQAMFEKWIELKPGATYEFNATIKAENVTGTKIKFGLMVPLNTGKTDWPDASVGDKTFDWSHATFTYKVPFTSKGTLLMCGIYAGKPDIVGETWFKNLTIHEIK